MQWIHPLAANATSDDTNADHPRGHETAIPFDADDATGRLEAQGPHAAHTARRMAPHVVTLRG